MWSWKREETVRCLAQCHEYCLKTQTQMHPYLIYKGEQGRNTKAQAIPVSKAGVPCSFLALPGRLLHSSVWEPLFRNCCDEGPGSEGQGKRQEIRGDRRGLLTESGDCNVLWAEETNEPGSLHLRWTKNNNYYYYHDDCRGWKNYFSFYASRFLAGAL